MDGSVEENINVINNFRYKKEEDHDDYIFIRTAKEEYKIKNKKDLINFGLKNTYISFDLLEQYCKLFDRSQFEVRFFLDDRDIKLTSDKIDFVVYKSDRSSIAAENRVKEYESYGVKTNKDNSSKGNKYKTMPISSISFLRPGDIKNLIIKLCFENKYILNRGYFVDKYGYEDYEKMIYLGIIKDDNLNIVINPLIFELINKMSSDIKYKNIKRINNHYNNKIFYDKYGDYIKQLFLRNEDICILIKLVKESNLLGRYSIQEILEYCIKSNYEELFIRVFIGDKPTNGIKPLKNFNDICFNCSGLKECIGQNLKNMSNEHISRLLLEYRNKHSRRCLKNIIETKDLSMLSERIIFSKFLTAYTVVVSIKTLLIYLGIIEEDSVLYKDKGNYCPKKDIWRVKHDLLVQPV